ncbi:DUF362 domain-containing protein [Paracoccus nototheniae]|uniref:hypothetical protein n=1 Tax=Paracoccus nototheniae TaxID=2489002 RepID=UPI00103ACC8F|nr:hypothetical protein [Paracoccus nototheniae]
MSLRALYGTDEVPRPGQRLTCGRAQVTLQDGHLRHLRVGGIEAIRSIAFLVRDRDWGIVAPQISGLRVDKKEQEIRVGWQADYTMGTGHLRAHIALVLTGSGLDATVQAHATGTVWTNRTGFSVLHPIEGVAGAPVRVDHPGGGQTQGRFPDLIAPWQPFMDIEALTHRAGPWQIACRFAGDVFEMEDQRQWGDASFKTYNRPLSQPWPYRIDAGAGPSQRVSLRWTHQPGRAVTPSPRAMVAQPRFPQTALLLDAPQARRATADPAAMRSIAPQRLLCHLDAGAGSIDADLRDFAALQAQCAGPAYDLELIAACPPQGDLAAEFTAYARAVAASGLRLASVMVTPAVDRQSVPPGSDWPACPPLDQIHAAARPAFPGLPLGGGVASFFPELNRKRPPVQGLDFITHGLCPIVHAADDVSVMETLQAVPQILASGRAIAGGVDYRLGPSTLAMRHNPYGSRTIPNPDRKRLCMTDDDPRQDGQFAAAWTCGLATALAPAGVTVWTPSELYGPRGLVDDSGAMRPVAGLVTALAMRAGARVGDARIDGWMAVLPLGDEVVVANLTPDPLPVPGHAALPGFGWRIAPAGELHPAPPALRSGPRQQDTDDEER